jgi:tetratricopeptide (TPR) repeat protein
MLPIHDEGREHIEESRPERGYRGVAAVLLVVAVALMLVHQKKDNGQTRAVIQAPAAERTESIKGGAESKDPQRELMLRTELEHDPHNEAAYNELRELVESRGSNHLLLEIVETWIAHNPPDWETMLHLDTTARVGLDDPEEAIREERLYLKRTARSADPQTWDSVESWLARNLMARGYDKEALAHFRHQAAVENRAGDWSELGDVELTLGMTQQAIADYRKALRIDAGYRYAHSGLSRAYTMLRDFQHAETEAQAAISIALHELEDKLKAKEHLRIIDGHDTVLSGLHQQFAQVYLTEGKLEKAIEEEDLAQKSDPDSFEAAMVEAMLYDHMGAIDKSKAVIDGVHEKVLELMSQAKDLSQENDQDKNKVLSKVSRWENVMALGRGGEEFHDDDDAMAPTAIWYLEPQLRAGTLKPLEEMALGRRYCEVGRIDECEKTQVTAMQADPELHTARAEHSLGVAMFKPKGPVAAKEHFRVAYELDPQNLTYRMDYQLNENRKTP